MISVELFQSKMSILLQRTHRTVARNIWSYQPFRHFKASAVINIGERMEGEKISKVPGWRFMTVDTNYDLEVC